MAQIFKNSDVRGRYPDEINEAEAGRLARAFGDLAGGSTVVLGRDNRDSSPALHEACLKGLMDAGCQVLDAGILTTPMLNFAKTHSGAKASLMITASHNPPDQNGLKPGLSSYPLPSEAMRAWRDLAERVPAPPKKGRSSKLDILKDYAAALEKHFGRGTLPLALDPGGGAACGLAERIFSGLGHKVESVNSQPGLSRADRPPDPVLPGALRSLSALVREGRSRLGLAFDGDGDRMVAVDEKGAVLPTDGAMALFAAEELARHPGGTVLFDVKMSQAVEDRVREAGGQPLRCPTGQLNVVTWLREKKGVLAGEYSGHYIFPDFAPYDDALAAALRLCRVVEAKGSLAALAAGLKGRYHPTPELRLKLSGDSRSLLARIQQGLAPGAKLETLDGIRASYPEGWGLVRASGTESALTFRFESLGEAGTLRPLMDKFLAGAPEEIKAGLFQALGEAPPL